MVKILKLHNFLIKQIDCVYKDLWGLIFSMQTVFKFLNYCVQNYNKCSNITFIMFKIII